MNDTGNNNIEMTDNEKADKLIELHNTQMKHIMQTREIEFKVNLALWTLIVLSGSFLYGKINLTNTLQYIIYFVPILQKPSSKSHLPNPPIHQTLYIHKIIIYPNHIKETPPYTSVEGNQQQ